MDKIWIIPISLFIIGIFGYGWMTEASDLDIHVTMDENTRDAIISLNDTIRGIEYPSVTRYNQLDCHAISEKMEIWCINGLR